MRSALVLVFAACAGTPVRPPVPPTVAEVRVSAATCLAPADAEAAIRRVLAEHHAEHSGLIVAVTVRATTGAHGDTASPTGASPTTASPTGASPTGASPTTASPTGASPTGASPTAASPTGASPTRASPTGASPARDPVAADGSDVTVTVTKPSGDVGLDRSYHLGPADCASGDKLVALAVDRWLTAFPEWAEPPRPPPPAPVRWTEVVAAAAVNSLWLPIGVEGEAAAIVDRGDATDRFGGTLRVRATVPQAAGSGHFQQTAFLAGATWRHRFGGWESRAELRGGRVLVIGMGFRENDHDWLWWWEAAGFVGRRFGWGSIGLEVAATALRDHAVTRDGLVSQDIPLLRFGIAGTFAIAR